MARQPVAFPDIGGAGLWHVISFEQLRRRDVDTDVFYGGPQPLRAVGTPATPVTPKPPQAGALAALGVLSRYLGVIVFSDPAPRSIGSDGTDGGGDLAGVEVEGVEKEVVEGLPGE